MKVTRSFHQQSSIHKLICRLDNPILFFLALGIFWLTYASGFYTWHLVKLVWSLGESLYVAGFRHPDPLGDQNGDKLELTK